MRKQKQLSKRRIKARYLIGRAIGHLDLLRVNLLDWVKWNDGQYLPNLDAWRR